ncbi:MAG: alpha/beta hydrolase [Fimbriimonas sp.]
MRLKRLWRSVMLFALGLVPAYGLMCWYLADVYLHPRAVSQGLMPSDLEEREMSLASETVDVWATPGLLKTPPPITFVMVHGYGGSQSHWSGVATELAKHGHGVIVPTLPGHHDSRDRSTGFGIKESKRIKGIVDVLRAAPGPKDRKIVLVGVSMGGSASWMATELGAKVDGVVSEGAFARFDTAMDGWFDHVVPGGRVLLRPVVWIASSKSGIDPSSVVPVRAAAAWHGKPSLVIQGAEDRLIPMPHAEALAKAAGCDLWIVPGARHASCSDVAGDAYVKRLEEFAQGLR